LITLLSLPHNVAFVTIHADIHTLWTIILLRSIRVIYLQFVTGVYDDTERPSIYSS